MNRQTILYDESKHLEFVMTEAAVRWQTGPESLMRAQVEKIIDVSSLGNVIVAIIPQASETAVWHDHGFNVLDDRSDNGDPVVHVETLTRGLNIADPAEVAAYKKAFAQLRQLAVAGAEAQALLRRIITSS